MANSKISALPAASTPLAGTELVPIVQSGITERVSIDNLTAGKTVPTGKLQASSTGEVIRGTTSGDVTTTGTNFWRFYDSGGAKGYIGYGGSAGRFDVNSGSGCNININATNGTMELATGNVTRVTIENSGNTTVVNGNFVIGTSGKGIDFSATPGTGTSELFADYEEGTWTPTNPQVSLTVTSAVYTKIGRCVNFQCRVAWPANADTNQASILGLPFTPSGQDYPVTVFSNSGAGASAYIPGSAVINLYTINQSAIYTNAQLAGLTLRITGFYFV